MPAPPRQRSFSAKSQRVPRPGPPRKKRRDDAVRDYLRPEEMDAMVQAARTSGHHRARDAAVILLMFRHGLQRVGDVSSAPSARTRRLEHEHREVRGKTKVHLPNRLIPGLGGERMMLQDLGVPEIAFQRATSSEPARSRHAVCQLHCLRCATHGVGHGK